MGLRSLLGRARAQVRADLRDDPYLRYILAAAFLLAAFWLWHRIPNFATRDERGRLFDALVAYGNVVADPSIEGLQEGVTWGRVPFGATLYLFGLAVLPVFLVALLTGQLDIFAAFTSPSPEFGYYPAWHATPDWVWWVVIGLVRLFSVCFAVGSVYLTYRIGVATADRRMARLAAVLLTLTFGFQTIAHEGGEDMPALFFVLLALYLLLRYVQTGHEWRFYLASASGGIAIAFKLTAAPVVGLVAVAHLLRARRSVAWPFSLGRPRLLAGGMAAGLVAIVVGFPTALVGGWDLVVVRIFGGSLARATHTTGPDAPIWWWFLRGYFSGMSLPLFLASVAGVGATAVSLVRSEARNDGLVLVLVALAAWVLLFSGWHDFRVHHLLPTFPPLALLLASALTRLREARPDVGRVVVAALLVTSGAYTVVGVGGYAAMPRDDATAWLQENAGQNATVEIYRRDIQDAAVPHDMRVNHLFGPEGGGDTVDPCPEYIQLGYRDLLYLEEGTYYRNGVLQRTYVRNLLDGEYNYEIAAEFGTRPPNFVPQRPTPGSVADLVRHGLVPQTDQYADEQELAANQYTVILRRTGPCDGTRPYPPF